MSNRTFVAFSSIVILLGFMSGFKLSALTQLVPSKLINVVGLVYDLLGVVVLTEIASSSEKWKNISVRYIAPFVLWVHTLVPLGVFLGAIAGFRHPSSRTLATFAVSFWGYSLIPLAILNETVVFPQFSRFKSIESRWRYFGIFLLLSGVGMQLLAALLLLRD